MTPYEVGYGDQTVGLFERETGIAIPVESSDPKRFLKRYRWLQSKAKEEWVAWRCQKVYQMDQELAERVQSVNPGWTFWRLPNKPIASQFSKWAEGRISHVDVYRHRGLDPRLYQRVPGPQFIEHYDIYDARKYSDALGRDDIAQAIRSWQDSSGYDSAGVFLRASFMLEAHLRSEREWPWRNLTLVANGAPMSWVKEIEKVTSYGRCETTFAVPIGWNDTGHMVGHEQQIRELARSYRDGCSDASPR